MQSADNQTLPLTLAVEDAGKLLGIGRNLAYSLVRAGTIPSLRLRALRKDLKTFKRELDWSLAG